MRAPVWLCTLWVALALLAGCASAPPQARGPDGANVAGPELPIAAAYSSEPVGPLMVGDVLDDALISTLSGACRDARLVPDGRLAELARVVAEATSGEAPSAALVSFHAQRLGLPDPTPQLWLANASQSTLVLSSMRAAVEAAREGEQLTHCGGAALRGGHGVIVAVALSRRLLSLATPIPRRIRVGESIALSATLAPGYDDASVAITEPLGEVRRIPLARGRKLKSDLRFDQRGEAKLEILASGKEGVTVIALLSLAVGVEPLGRAPGADAAEVERDPETVQRVLSALIAGERQRRNLPALEPHAGLASIARAHTDDMLAHQFVAHTSATTGEAQDRVARAGLSAVVLLENIGRGYSAAELHAGLMDSPGHRANILNKDVRSLGIGVGAEREGSRQAFVATELFAQLARSTNFKTAQRDLFEAIQARRKRQALTALSFDAQLSQRAQAAADAFARDPRAGDEATLAAATRGLRTLPNGARALSAALIQAVELPQVADTEQLLLSELVAVGIGVAALPSGSARPLAVVLLLALRR